MKLLINLRIVVFVVAALTVVSAPLPLSAQQDVVFERSTLSIQTAVGTTLEFDVEIAGTAAQKSRGLMFRREMADDAGMLFPYRRNQVVTMWMANTYLSLDMLFIEADGRIARIEENTIPVSREVISSRTRVRGVLELKAGTARKLGIAVGDRVIHEHFQYGKARGFR